jgi:hypothetical protein
MIFNYILILSNSLKLLYYFNFKILLLSFFLWFSNFIPALRHVFRRHARHEFRIPSKYGNIKIDDFSDFDLTLIYGAIAFGTANILLGFPCGPSKEGGTTATRKNAEELAFPGAMAH